MSGHPLSLTTYSLDLINKDTLPHLIFIPKEKLTHPLSKAQFSNLGGGECRCLPPPNLTLAEVCYVPSIPNSSIFLNNIKTKMKPTSLEANKTRDEIAQARTQTPRHMNNAWSEMVSCSPCFAFYCFSSCPWFIQTIWDNSYPSQTSVMALF